MSGLINLLQRVHYSLDQAIHILLTGERWRGSFEDWRKLT